LEYEELRRKIETQARELSYFTGNQLNKISEKLSDNDKNNWKNVISRFTDQTRFLLASIRNLTEVDGYQQWREQEHASLSKLMQARLKRLQNPTKSCEDVKRVTCNINKGCGYGCEIHHAMHCFHIAYALGRPMILFSGISKIFKNIIYSLVFFRWLEI
jgi:glycoprotein 6-alpha-L-fucosyltransferase